MGKRRTADEDRYDVEFYDKESKVKTIPLKAKSKNQGYYLSSMSRNILTFGIGPAGTGKTYVATRAAAEALLTKRVSKIIITRPVVEAGENLGFLPGELEEKFDPYFQPVKQVLEQVLGKGRVGYCIKNKIIQAMPLAYMRGHNFDDAFVIFDEAQNATKVQMKLFLTRLGENTVAVVNGDPRQTDIRQASGLQDAMKRLGNLLGVQIVQFEQQDIVRSGFCQAVVEAYESSQNSVAIMSKWTNFGNIALSQQAHT
jgi:phosphate starvation-inducible PhoH-like protein